MKLRQRFRKDGCFIHAVRVTDAIKKVEDAAVLPRSLRAFNAFSTCVVFPAPEQPTNSIIIATVRDR